MQFYVTNEGATTVNYRFFDGSAGASTTTTFTLQVNGKE